MSQLKSALHWALLFYLVTSLLHFSHNAQYLTSYPNLPHWLTQSEVYLAWICITAVGGVGYFLQRRNHQDIGLALIGVYAAEGFDGLLHYRLAPFMAHTLAMNITICLEVFAAGLLLTNVLLLMTRQARWRDA